MKNLVILMADALRADFFPGFPGTTVKTIADVNTPKSFTGILSGSKNHGVEFFTMAREGYRKGNPQKQRSQVPTVFDLSGYDTSYFDHPDDPFYLIVNNPPRKKLEEIGEPFVYVERETATHVPYGYNWRLHDAEIAEEKDGRKYPDIRGRDYIDEMREHAGEERPFFVEDYEKGVELVEDRVEEIATTLKERGSYENTLFVVTSDHGDCFGPYDNCHGFIHNCVCEHVVDVKTCFYDRNVEVDEPLLNTDILEVWWPDWKKSTDKSG